VNATNSSVTFMIREATSSDAGLYRCVVDDVLGQRWNDTTIVSVNGTTHFLGRRSW